jgi:Fe2+ transport system protein FeoA
MVNIHRSKLARIFSRLLPKSKVDSAPNVKHLVGINPGELTRIAGFASTIPADRQAHLQSYGLIPGRIVRVMQHSPVTIIQVEHTELAIEREMAQDIHVETPEKILR